MSIATIGIEPIVTFAYTQLSRIIPNFFDNTII